MDGSTTVWATSRKGSIVEFDHDVSQLNIFNVTFYPWAILTYELTIYYASALQLYGPHLEPYPIYQGV